MRVLGIDLSLTGTGLALITPEAARLQFHGSSYYGDCDCWVRRISPSPDLPMFDRWKHVLEIIGCWSAHADVVVIEGYSFASAQGTRACMEIGGIVRYYLHHMKKSPIEVSPNSLKKFVSGNAVAKKNTMLLEAYKRWGLSFGSDDIADAFGLAKIGEALSGGHEHLPKFQQEVIVAIKAGPKPKKVKLSVRR